MKETNLAVLSGKEYISPKVRLISLNDADIVTASNYDPGEKDPFAPVTLIQ